MQRVQTYAKADQKSFLKSIAVCRCCRELCGQYNVMISGAEIQFRQINKKLYKRKKSQIRITLKCNRLLVCPRNFMKICSQLSAQRQTRKCGNYVLPLNAARRDSISNLTSLEASNLSCRQIQCRFI